MKIWPWEEERKGIYMVLETVQMDVGLAIMRGILFELECEYRVHLEREIAKRRKERQSREAKKQRQPSGDVEFMAANSIDD